MGVVLSFMNEKQKKQMNLEKKLLRELSIEKIMNIAEECFTPLIHFFQNIRIFYMTAVLILRLKHICSALNSGSSVIMESPSKKQ
ncbi:DUF2521 family protein [Bacillus sonorensis]|nr:DUF2521 family protein [Bacillus sonorensis]